MSVRARAPVCKQESKVGAVHVAIAVDVGAGERRAHRAPEGEKCAEVCSIDDSGWVEVIGVTSRAWNAFFAAVGDVVAIAIRERTVEALAIVNDAVAVAVGGPLRHVGAYSDVVVGVTIVSNIIPHSALVDVVEIVIGPSIWTRTVIKLHNIRDV